jgi:hypothetical protein
MSTLDKYLAPRVPVNETNGILLNVILLGVDLKIVYAEYALSFKLHALLQIIRELQNQAGCAVVDSIRDHLLIRGIVKSESEVSKLLKLAHREGLITQGSIPSTWMAKDHDATHFARYVQNQAVTAV